MKAIIFYASFLTVFLFGWALICPATAPRATNTAAVDTPAAFDEAEYVRALWDGIFLLAGGRQVETIQVADGRSKGGERVIIISYRTTESTRAGYVDEWIDLFSAVAATIRGKNLDVDSVSLVAGSAGGQAIGTLTTSVDDLLAFHEGRISRGDFLGRLVTATF